MVPKGPPHQGQICFGLSGPWLGAGVWITSSSRLARVPPTSAFTGCHLTSPPAFPLSANCHTHRAAVTLCLLFFFSNSSLQGALIRRPTFTLCCFPSGLGEASRCPEGCGLGLPSDNSTAPPQPSISLAFAVVQGCRRPPLAVWKGVQSPLEACLAQVGLEGALSI